jgi:O-acetyl-ADP-ribose deacetylase (regulator of RNase III)
MITYLVGDATQPAGKGEPMIIAHVCNDIGGWGRGFVLSLTQRYPEAEKAYRNWFQMNEVGGDPELVPFRLGRMKIVRVSNNVAVANMIAQHGVSAENGVPPIRYAALEDCLAELRLLARATSFVRNPEKTASVHMPRIGCGLAGGEWSKVEEIINRMMPDVDVYVYDFDTKDARTIPWKK